jgi:lipid-A-disaccharide synthase
MVIKTRFITLLNIAVGRAVVPELVQDQCQPTALAQALAARLDDPHLRQEQIAAQNQALAAMGARDGPDPSEKAAKVIVELLNGSA